MRRETGEERVDDGEKKREEEEEEEVKMGRGWITKSGWRKKRREE